VKYVVGFARFWYEFIVGDDWLVAAGVAVALALTWMLAHRDISSWWLMPLAVVALLVFSLRRATRSNN
jgi:hypothetical protein